jgi:transcriptional regulator with XRE-family HTH domain
MSENKYFNTLNRIQQLCNEKGWTIYKLAQQSGIPYSNLNNIFNRGTQPTVPTLEKICSGFNITLSEFFTKDTPLNIASDNLSIEEHQIIDRYRTLNRNDKKLFQAYLDGLTKN